MRKNTDSTGFKTDYCAAMQIAAGRVDTGFFGIGLINVSSG